MNSTKRNVIITGVIVVIIGILLYFTPLKDVKIDTSRRASAPLPALVIGIGISIIYCAFKIYGGKKK